MAFNKLVLLVASVGVWLLFAMVYFEQLPPLLDSMGAWIMPWKHLFDPTAENTLPARMIYMGTLLDRSVIVANVGMFMIVSSITAFAMYATFMFQQKQRRAREHDLLIIKNREIAKRNEFIRYISATIGHEFKNNLGRIKRRIDLISLPDDAREKIDVNMEKLFSDINIFKRISDEREAGLIEFERTDIVEMLRSASAQYSDLADFAIETGMPQAYIYAAKTLLKTVFENLIDNAVKNKKPDQPKASISFLCATEMDGNRKYVSISVRDRGVGMDEQAAEKCFYKCKSSGEGWGEGLYFAKYVIGLHAGVIKVGKEYTSPGQGAEIIIKLPFIEEVSDV